MNSENLKACPSEQSDTFRALVKIANGTPELLSLLYDLDLMPEQLKFPSQDGNRMIVLINWFVSRQKTYPEKGRLVEALAQLTSRLRAVHDDPKYIGVWTIAQNHFGPYTGMQYVDELEAAEELLTQLKKGPQ